MIVGAGQLQREPVVVVHQREIERPALDREFVRAEAQCLTGSAELGTIAQVAQRGLFQRAQASGELVGGHRRT